MGNLFKKSKEQENLETKKLHHRNHEEEDNEKKNKREIEEKPLLLELKEKLSKYSSGKELIQIKLFQKLSPLMKKENIIYAPIGIDMLLSLCSNGASGETLKEMLTTLNYESVDEANKVHFDILEKIKKYGPNLRLTNLILSRIQNEPNFIEIAKKFEAKIDKLIDVEQINAWVKEKTEGKIEKILEELDPFDGMVLLNAIYFEAKWQNRFFPNDGLYKFKPELRESVTFYNYGDKSKGVIVQMMEMNEIIGYYENEQIQAINLKYQNFSELSAVIILPKENIPIDNYIDSLDFDSYYNLILELKKNFERVFVHFPQFEINSGNELKDQFNELGIKKAMTLDAEFKGISNEDILFIRSIMQKCYIKVDEYGTIATACSAVVATIGCAVSRQKAIEFKVNRPFLFIIRNDNFMLGHDILFCSKICKL